MTTYRTNQDVEVTGVEDDLFLVHPVNGAVYHLDPIGAGLWRLLGEGVHLDAIMEVLTAAFPEIPAKKLKGDVTRILREMCDQELILEE